MTADELSKGLSKNQIHGDDYGLFNRRIQNMLRQQQAEIDALKKELYFKDYYEELPDTPVDLLRKAQEK
jgi:hypothetical protein